VTLKNQGPFTHNPPTVLRRKEVLRRTGLTRSTLYRLISKGKFPTQHRLSEATVGWSEEEVNAWINGCFVPQDLQVEATPLSSGAPGRARDGDFRSTGKGVIDFRIAKAPRPLARRSRRR
jgi:prophage regulatory protein